MVTHLADLLLLLVTHIWLKWRMKELNRFKSIFNRRHVDDIFNESKKNVKDILFKRPSDYYQDIKLTIEIILDKVFETKKSKSK